MTGLPPREEGLHVRYQRRKGSSRTRQATRCPADVRSGAYDKGSPSKHRIQAKGSEPSTSARNGVPMYDRACQTLTLSIRRNRTCPWVCLAGE